MKKYLVIGNPISHSLSPKLHNYWIKENKIDAVYNKQRLNAEDLKILVSRIRNREIAGVNVTVPFKKDISSYLDKLSPEAESTQSVNTICLNNNKVTGHNTDISGFEFSIEEIKYRIAEKKILILGAGGVVPSIIFALNKMKASTIILSNRTRIKAENLKKQFKDLIIVDWGSLPDFDMVINATSLGLNNEDVINLDFTKVDKGKLYYDLIYNPEETNFLKKARELNNKTENGKRMFVYQAAAAFKIWHGVQPQINKETFKLL